MTKKLSHIELKKKFDEVKNVDDQDKAMHLKLNRAEDPVKKIEEEVRKHKNRR